MGTPIINYDHTAADGNRLSFPVGIGFAKTTRAGNTPLKFQVQLWKYVVRPDNFGSDWQLRISITPVLKLPWG